MAVDILTAIQNKETELATLRAAAALLEAAEPKTRPEVQERTRAPMRAQANGKQPKVDMIRAIYRETSGPLHVRTVAEVLKERFGVEMKTGTIASYTLTHPDEFKKVAPNTFELKRAREKKAA